MPNKLTDFRTTAPFLSNSGTAFSFPCDHEMGNGRFLTWFQWQSEWQSELMFFFPYQRSRKLTHTNLHLFKFSEFDSCLYPWNGYHSYVRNVLWEPAPKTPVAPSPVPLVPGKQSPVVTINSFAFYINRLNAVCMFLSSFTQHTDF